MLCFNLLDENNENDKNEDEENENDDKDDEDGGDRVALRNQFWYLKWNFLN